LRLVYLRSVSICDRPEPSIMRRKANMDHRTAVVRKRRAPVNPVLGR
jgi:hypothetical protein